MLDLSNEKHKTLKKETKEDTRRWEDLPYFIDLKKNSFKKDFFKNWMSVCSAWGGVPMGLSNSQSCLPTETRKTLSKY